MGYSPDDPLEQTRQCKSEATEEVERADEGNGGPTCRSGPSHEEGRERRQAEQETRDSEGSAVYD